MSNLSKKRCVPCEGGTKPLPVEEAKRLLGELDSSWALADGKLSREFRFRDFKESMEFVNKVAKIAEEEWHHPDISIYFNKVNIELFTHSIKGLSENDFIVAAKVDAISVSLV